VGISKVPKSFFRMGPIKRGTSSPNKKEKKLDEPTTNNCCT
jgi:hypothetical protein